jgi:3-hydroxyacyl-CoA dehydrogenase/enoyl-CoA hydratase/3-hydroxybutyryl-CoA epimerase
MAAAFGERLQPTQSFSKALAAGRLGRKNRKGFFLYDERGKKRGVDESVYALLSTGAKRTEMARDDIQRRCALAMANEAVRCLEEGIIRTPRDGDIGAVFGIGFPPFRGGPFRHLDAIGAAAAVQQLEALNARHPGRFVPSAMLVQMARDGARFYPAAGKPVG